MKATIEIDEQELLRISAAQLGRKGGQSRSPKKMAAMRRNLPLAWKAQRRNGKLRAA
jgi:hypothetical protein